MSKKIVTINSNYLVSLINEHTRMHFNKGSALLTQRLAMFGDVEGFKTISVKEYQKNKHKYELVNETKFVDELNKFIKRSS